jgi:hypothetical protein
VRYHILIAEAIRERRPLQARLLMLAHVNDAIDALLKLQPGVRNDQLSSVATSSTLIIDQRAFERP